METSARRVGRVMLGSQRVGWRVKREMSEGQMRKSGKGGLRVEVVSRQLTDLFCRLKGWPIGLLKTTSALCVTRLLDICSCGLWTALYYCTMILLTILLLLTVLLLC